MTEPIDFIPDDIDAMPDREKCRRFTALYEFALERLELREAGEYDRDYTEYCFETMMEICLANQTRREFWSYWNKLPCEDE